MSYRKYLTRYGSPADSAEIRPYIYLVDPAKLTTARDIEWRVRYRWNTLMCSQFSVLACLRNKNYVCIMPTNKGYARKVKTTRYSGG